MPISDSAGRPARSPLSVDPDKSTGAQKADAGPESGLPITAKKPVELFMQTQTNDMSGRPSETSKTGLRVAIPAGTPLRAALENKQHQPTSAVTILTTEAGRAWTESGFRASWRKACEKAGFADVTFHDLRGTAVPRLAMAGCNEAEIATITGQSLRDVGAILDSHYLKRDHSRAISAINKLETRTTVPKNSPNRAERA